MPNVDVPSADVKLIIGSEIQRGLIVPVKVEGTYCSTEIVILFVAEQVEAPTV